MTHFLQSKYWRKAKRNLGNEIFEAGEYFFHTTTLPFGLKVGYMPRPDLNKIDWKVLAQSVKKAGCVFVTTDPLNEKIDSNLNYAKDGFPIFSDFDISDNFNPIRHRGVALIKIRESGKYLAFTKDSGTAGTLYLSGGLVEEGETPLQAAIRETQEEIGIKNLKLVGDEIATCHRYYERKGVIAHNLEHYFLFEITSDDLKNRDKAEVDVDGKLREINLEDLKKNKWCHFNWLVDKLLSTHKGVTLPNEFSLEKGTPIHLQENIILDLTKSDDQLLSEMKSKHRYNLGLAQRKGVEVIINNSEENFMIFQDLYQATVERKDYHGRSKNYIDIVKKTLDKESDRERIYTIATAMFEGKALASWFLFLDEETIYYPYGGSSEENKNVMAPYALVWQIIQWGKENGYKNFDLWGIKQNSNSTTSEPEYDGYSRFKVGFGGRHVVYEDTIDLVLNPVLYKLLKVAKKFRGF